MKFASALFLSALLLVRPTMASPLPPLPAPNADSPPREGANAVDVSSKRPSVFVHVIGPPALMVEQHEQDGSWSTACRVPCDSYFAAGTLLRVNGRGIPPSPAVALSGTRMILEVSPAFRAGLVWGTLLTLGGGAMLAISSSMLVKSRASTADTDCDCAEDQSALYATGILFGLVLTVAGVVGVVHAIREKTTVTVAVEGESNPVSPGMRLESPISSLVTPGSPRERMPAFGRMLDGAAATTSTMTLVNVRF